MLHHVSFNVRNPERAAAALADMPGARALRAPAPPFPQSAWFVCCGDQAGTPLEILPWGETRNARSARGLGFDAQMRETSGCHVLMSTERGADTIFKRAELEGWRAEHAHAGLFAFIKVWVESAFLVELMTPEMSAAYVSAFGAADAGRMDQRLRALEAAVAARSAKPS